MIRIVYALGFAAIFVLALFFSLKNLQPVSVNLFIGTVNIPLAFALTAEFLVGAAIGMGVEFAYLLRFKAENGKLRKRLALVEQEIEYLRGSSSRSGD